MNFGNIDRILLLGGGDVLTRLATQLKAKKKDVVVITSPRHLDGELIETKKTLRDALDSLKIPYVVSEELTHDPKVTSLITPKTLGLSFGAAWIFRKEFIDRFDGKLLNSHGARLPFDRGGGFLSWSIMRGERLSCHLLHQVTVGVDRGPIVYVREFVFPNHCRIVDEHFRYYIGENVGFVSEFLALVEKGHIFALSEQPDYLGTYWPRLSTENQGWLNWSWTREEILSFICAFDDPYQGVSTLIGDERVYIKKAFPITTDGTFHPFQQGLVYRKSKDAIFVVSKEGGIGISELRDSNGKDLRSTVKLGDRLFTPSEMLDAAMQYRAVYTEKSVKKAA